MKKYAFLTMSAFAACAFAADVDIASFKNPLVTEELQKAIDSCSASGGGIVRLPSTGETYMCGTVRLKDGVRLFIPPSTTLKADEKTAVKHFIFAEGAKNVGVFGGGTIDGNGSAYGFVPNSKAPRNPNRGHMLQFDLCENVGIYDITVQNGSSWSIHLFKNDTVQIRGVRIKSQTNHNNDGIDIQSKNVTISDCVIDCGDDAIVFKNHDRDYTVENVAITNCVLATNCNFIKIGTASYGGFKNITVSNCVLKRAYKNIVFNWAGWLKWAHIDSPILGISGIALECVDGGWVDQVAISNISMTGVQTPIFIRVADRKRFVESESLAHQKRAEMGDNQKSRMKNVVISSVVATAESTITNSITAAEGCSLKNITLRDVFLLQKASPDVKESKKALSKPVRDAANTYPENRIFGVIPAYGMYVKNADNITFDNLQMCYYGAEEIRPAFLLQDTRNVRIINSIWQKPKGDQPSILVRGGEQPVLTNCTERADSFLQ